MAGIVLFTAASVLCGIAPTLWLLVAARAAQGLAAAGMTALAMALVAETVPREKTGSAMGLLGTLSAVGTALGPSLGGLLIAGLGWRAIFLVQVPLSIAALLLGRRHVPGGRRHPNATRPAFDLAGTLRLAFTLRAGLATSALVSTVMMATLVVGPFYLARGLGLDTAIVGIVMSVGPMVSALTGLPAGRIVDRLGARRMSLIGLAANAAGCLALGMVPMSWGVAGYVLPIVVVTAGYAIFQAANNTAVMADVAADQRGVVSGMLNLSRNLGLITGASAMGAVFTFASRVTGVATTQADAVAAGLRVTFAVAAGLVIVALAIAASTRRREGGRTRRDPPTSRPRKPGCCRRPAGGECPGA